MTRKLHISPDLALPLEFLTSTQAIVAKKRVGKSYTAQVEAEELLAAGQQVVVLDPTGAWWGLRSSADGKSAGYPITIFGGDHGDVPLEATAGEVLAQALVADRFSAVLDLTTLKKGERVRFIADFLETLYRLNREAMHLFIDEADVAAPQKTFTPDQARALGAADEIVRRGGIRGIGVTLITQRPQVVNKDVLSQIDQLVVLQMNHPKDIGAIKDWLLEYVDAGVAKEMIASLPSLPKGEAWVWAPATKQFQRIRIRAKHTFDSGKTPEAGKRAAVPKVLAPVDVERLGAAIAATVQRAKENDVKVLRARIVELEKQLAKGKPAIAAAPAATVETKIVEKPVILPADLKRLEQLFAKLNATQDRADKTTSDAVAKIEAVYGTLDDQFDGIVDVLREINRRLAASAPTNRELAAQHFANDGKVTKLVGKHEIRVPAQTGGRVYPSKHAAVRSAPAVRADVGSGDTKLEPRHAKILAAIAWWNAIGVDAPDVAGVAFVAGYSPTSSSFEKARGALRSAGYIDYPSSGTVRLTDQGHAATPAPDRPATAAELQAAVLEQLEPRHGKLLRPLLDQYPSALTMDALAAAAEYSASSSSFEKARGKLRSLGLVEYPRPGQVRATDLLFPGGVR